MDDGPDCGNCHTILGTFAAFGPGCPDEQPVCAFAGGCCPWDCGDGDGNVSVPDLLALLAQWEKEGTSCDFFRNGVGNDDLLKLLAAWGPCP